MNHSYNNIYDNSDDDSYYSDHDSYYSDYDAVFDYQFDNESNYSNDNYDKGTTLIHSKSTTSKYNHSLDNIEINPFIRNLYVTPKDFKSSNNKNDKENQNKENLSLMKEFSEDLNIVELNYFIEFEKKI